MLETAISFLSNIVNNSSLIKYIGVLLFVSLSGVVLYYAAADPYALSTDTYKYFLYIILPLIALLVYFIPSILRESNVVQIALIIILFGAFVFAIVYSFTTFSYTSLSGLNYLINGVILVGFFVGLAILFLMIGNTMKHQKGWMGFFIYFLFYIPCLLIDFVKYATNEFKSTATPIYYLFIIEIVIVLIYLYLPPLIQYILLKDGTMIFKGPMFLNENQIISPDKSVQIDRPGPGFKDLITENDPITYRTTYSISMWVYLNAQDSVSSASKNELNLFNYGGGKPRITYFNDLTDSTNTNVFNFYFTNNETVSSKYQVSLPSQKWNFFVLNYTSNVVDLFINGALNHTFTFDNNNSPSYLASDRMEIGASNGLNGAICNVKYYTSSLSKSQIANYYNLLIMKNPPIQ